VLEKCYIFLIKFVKNNPENQFLLVDYIDLFVDDLEYGVHSWELIAEVFKNSELLLTYNFHPLIKKVIKLIDSLPKETQKIRPCLVSFPTSSTLTEIHKKKFKIWFVLKPHFTPEGTLTIFSREKLVLRISIFTF